MRQHTNAFTLIELLVVVAVISIIAAILLPAFVQARSKARMITCLSNERQLGVGIFQYAQDFDDHFPIGTYPTEPGMGWAGQVLPYVRSSGVYKCPDDGASSQLGTSSPGHLMEPISYAINANIARKSNIDGNIALLSSTSVTIVLSEITFPNQQFYPGEYNVADLSVANELNPFYGVPSHRSLSPTGDGINATNGAAPVRYSTGYSGGPARSSTHQTVLFDRAEGRHNGGSNYLLADGHVKWLLGDRVSTGTQRRGCPSLPSDPQDYCLPSPAGTASIERWAATYSTL